MRFASQQRQWCQEYRKRSIFEQPEQRFDQGVGSYECAIQVHTKRNLIDCLRRNGFRSKSMRFAHLRVQVYSAMLWNCAVLLSAALTASTADSARIKGRIRVFTPMAASAIMI